MKTCLTLPELRSLINSYRQQGQSIAFVPTMGALHEGHMSLIHRARELGERVIVSIFVNPTQFENAEDLQAYPSTIERDGEMLEKVGVDLLFLPSKEVCYAENFKTWVEVSELSEDFEGRHRPGHFRGVTTVVSMLFNMVTPDFAVFGEKDFQQLRLIEQLVEDLKFPVEIVRSPTVREESGLAMSSRNARLSDVGRAQAAHLYRALSAVRDAFLGGEKRASELCSLAESILSEIEEITVEYLEVVNPLSFRESERADERARLVSAVYVEGVRLIDNVGFGE